MKNLINYLKKNLIIIISVIILIIGISTIIIFAFIKPFNDWSFCTDSELFWQYGDFIGGFIGTLFSLVAVILLYKTLTTQRKSLNKQEEAFRINQFETTFFNLLKTQQEIVGSNKAYFISLNNKLEEVTYNTHARENFIYSKAELLKIWESIEQTEYLGSFDKSEVKIILNKIEMLEDSSRSDYISEDVAENKKEGIIHEENLRLTNRQYQITKEKWEYFKKENPEKRIKLISELFFDKYQYVFGHYYRHLYCIISFVNQFENSDFGNKELAKKYIDFIQAQISSIELMLLFYKAILSPELLILLIDYKFFKNLKVEDLIHESHNRISGINLKD